VTGLTPGAGLRLPWSGERPDEAFRTRHAVPGPRQDGVDGETFLAANAVGSAALAGTAVIGREWGFILLEAVWAAVSVSSIVRKAAGRPVAGSH
jgi:hypothetical protein